MTYAETAPILITDSAYGPTRAYCDSVLKRLVSGDLYDPLSAPALKTLMKPNTRLVYGIPWVVDL